MGERVITVSDRLIRSLFQGIVISFAILLAIHFFSDYAVTFNGRILYNYILTCSLGENHVFKGGNVSPSDLANGHFSTTKFIAVIQSSIHHWLLLILIATVFVVILQMNVKIKLQADERDVINEEPKPEVRAFTRGEKYVIVVVVIFLLAIVGFIIWSA